MRGQRRCSAPGWHWEQHCDWECQSCHYGQEWQRKHCYGWECHRNRYAREWQSC